MTADPTRLPLRLASRRTLVSGTGDGADDTARIVEFTLASTGTAPLPAFDPGAHITVQTPAGAMRRYSLIGDPAVTDQYVIAVQRDDNGRGGSRAMVDDAQIGDTVEVDPPSNEFALVEAPHYLLIAGGIGITPILSMIRALQRAGNPNWQLIYCTRSAEQTAFLDELNTPALAQHVTVHHDNGNPDQFFDFWPLFETPGDAHIYCCGPSVLMDEVRDMTGHWPMNAVHFENFAPVQAVHADDKSFNVRIGNDGEPITVGANQTILEALRDAGHDMRSSCESGTCASCKTRYLKGDVIHRDLCLTDDERETHLTLCVSRAANDDLVIEL